MKSLFTYLCICLCCYSCSSQSLAVSKNPGVNSDLLVKVDKANGRISIHRLSGDTILVQNAKSNERPFIHPIIAPDGKGVLTEYRPRHHPHQTGIYWGFKLLNGRDYFMKWQGDYWRKISDTVLKSKGQQVVWQTKYDLLDEKGNATLTEISTWTLQEIEGKYLLDLLWNGKANTDITFGKFYVGGLFLRMPWYKGIPGEVVNANGQRNAEAEGQRSIWTDVGVSIQGRTDWGHIAIFDHPQNKSFPIAWRVDSELGVGPSRQIIGDWKLKQGQTEIVRYRLVVYTGDLNNEDLNRLWKEFSCSF
jgi:hypothetical protein